MKRAPRLTKRERKERPRESGGVLQAFILANPFALATGPDGALYVAADQQGKIWRVTYSGGR